jgi:nucleotide-binding universal stress UspA family protein
MKSVLAAIDFSAGTKQVVAEAIVLARAIGARLVVLHVVQPPPITDVDVGAQMSALYAAQAREAAASELAALQKKLQAAAITIQTTLLVGVPGAQVVAYAQELRADFIVLGSHGHGALYDLIVGHTASYVLKRAACSVVVVPQSPGKKRAATPKIKW